VKRNLDVRTLRNDLQSLPEVQNMTGHGDVRQVRGPPGAGLGGFWDFLGFVWGVSLRSGGIVFVCLL